MTREEVISITKIRKGAVLAANIGRTIDGEVKRRIVYVRNNTMLRNLRQVLKDADTEFIGACWI